MFTLDFVTPAAAGTGIPMNINFFKSIKINHRHLLASCKEEQEEDSDLLGSHKGGVAHTLVQGPWRQGIIVFLIGMEEEAFLS